MFTHDKENRIHSEESINRQIAAQILRRIWFPELPYYIIQKFSLKKKSMRQVNKYDQYKRVKAVARNCPWGSPDVGLSRQNSLSQLFQMCLKNWKKVWNFVSPNTGAQWRAQIILKAGEPHKNYEVKKHKNWKISLEEQQRIQAISRKNKPAWRWVSKGFPVQGQKEKGVKKNGQSLRDPTASSSITFTERWAQGGRRSERGQKEHWKHSMQTNTVL